MLYVVCCILVSLCSGPALYGAMVPAGTIPMVTNSAGRLKKYQSDKKMSVQQWGSRFVHIHQERTTKKVRAQGFTRPESFKDKMIREGKSHPDPNDPSFPQYFKTKAIRNTSQELQQKVSEANTDGNSTNHTETPSSAMPNPGVTPKRTGGICSTLTNIFSPGDANPKNSSPSESSASYVDPDVAEKIIEEGIAETATPSADTLENPTASNSNAVKESEDNPDETVHSDGEVENEHIDITIETIETNASSEEATPQNNGISEAIADDPQEGTIPEEWTTVTDKRIERKNRKARKNKEHKQKKQAKQLLRQAKHGPAWAHQGGVLPSSSDSANGSPRHSSSDSNQNSQSQEIHEDGSNSNGSPGGQGERSDSGSRADSHLDPNLSEGSQGEGDYETETEGSNSGNQSDFH
jgi:hypothetical protein